MPLSGTKKHDKNQPDNAAGLLMYQKKVDVVLFGADRVTANGDVANKVGTMKVAVVAREFGVPVYAVVPTSTIDLTLESGTLIPIEERSATEVRAHSRAKKKVYTRVFNSVFI